MEGSVRRMFALAVLVGSVWSESAWAGDCDAPYTADQLLTELGTVESFLFNNDNAAAGKAAAQMEAHLGCLNEILPPIILGRAYRAVGGGLYSGGNTARGQLWLNTAMVVDPTFDYGTEDLPSGHPVGNAWIDTRKISLGDPVKVPDKIFGAGTHFVDGKKTSTPQAVANVPHIYQRVDGGVVTPWMIDGNNFPAEVLAAPVVAVVAEDPKAKKPKEVKAPKPEKEPAVADADPKPEKEPKPGKEPAVAEAKPAKEVKPGKAPTTVGGVAVIDRKRPPEKTPIMIGGGLVMVGAGGLYFLASQAYGDFDDGKTLEEITAAQTKTNRLVVMSGVALAVGAGTLTWGVILDSHGTPLPGINVRF